MQNETTEIQTVSDETKKDRSKTRMNTDNNSIEFLGNSDEIVESYSINDLPQSVKTHLALIGLRTQMHSSKDRGVSFRALQDGELPGRATPIHLRGAAAWREAYAQFLVEGGHETDIASARGKSENLDAEDLRKVKNKPRVMALHAKLTGQRDADDPLPEKQLSEKQSSEPVAAAVSEPAAEEVF